MIPGPNAAYAENEQTSEQRSTRDRSTTGIFFHCRLHVFVSTERIRVEGTSIIGRWRNIMIIQPGDAGFRDGLVEHGSANEDGSGTGRAKYR